MTVNISSSRHSDEAARIAAVERYGDLGTEFDEVFGDIASLAAKLFTAPMAALTLIDGDRIWFLAVHGLDVHVRHIGHGDGLCASVIAGELPHLVEDALTNPLTADRSFVLEHQVRFYACAPMVTAEGHRVGAVAVMDTVARFASDGQLALLENLAALVTRELDLQRLSRESLRGEQRLRDIAEDARDDARLDRDTAQTARDQARRDRDTARSERDGAVREREVAERDLDVVEAYATALQATLLPPLLPDVPGLSLAAHYRPASPRQVGGDFYDVFPLGGERWGFFIGDVEGHGVQAAVATSLIRYTLRSGALHFDDPTGVLSELNTVMLRELRPRRFCTALFGLLQPHPDGTGFQVTLATGGHQPALLLDPIGGVVHQVRASTGMGLGLVSGATFGACSLRLRPGQTLLLYTDGLIEARRGAAAFDVDALAGFLGQHLDVGAQELTTDIATLATKLDPDDDVAVLAIKATLPNELDRDSTGRA